ncbi:hypothetical protein Tco_1560430 [Tanacetum coccineum]
MLPKCVQRIPPNKHGKGGRGKNSIRHQPGDILLFKNTFWFKEFRSDLPTFGRKGILEANWQELGEKSLPFFKTLKKCMKKSDFQWTAEAEAAFKKMKKLIAELPTPTAPIKKEELIVYLAEARKAKWSRELGEYDIQYKPRISVKRQILIDFILERPKDDSLAAPMEVEEELSDPWTLFTEGSSSIDGFEAGLILTDPEGI